MSKFYVIGKASPELLKKMHADPTADRGAVMKSMCESLGVKAISYEWLRGRFDVLFCVEGDYESVLAMKVTVLNSGMMSDLMVHEVFDYNSAFKKASDASKSYTKPGESKERKTMSILEKYSAALKNKDEAVMNDLLHDDFKFTMHKSGNVLTKSDVIKWAMSGDINQDKVRIVYENDEVGIHHAFVKFNDGNVEAVMAVYKYDNGKIVSLETGATPMPK